MLPLGRSDSLGTHIYFFLLGNRLFEQGLCVRGHLDGISLLPASKSNSMEGMTVKPIAFPLTLTGYFDF